MGFQHNCQCAVKSRPGILILSLSLVDRTQDSQGVCYVWMLFVVNLFLQLKAQLAHLLCFIKIGLLVIHIGQIDQTQRELGIGSVFCSGKSQCLFHKELCLGIIPVSHVYSCHGPKDCAKTPLIFCIWFCTRDVPVGQNDSENYYEGKNLAA